MNSFQYLNEGSSQKFINSLIYEIHQHPALSHPYLLAMSRGDFKDMNNVIRDYANQYSVYSSRFVDYLNGVINALPIADHKALLMENLEEELGSNGSLEGSDKPHVEIFNDFKNIIGVDKNYEAQNPPSTTSLLWRDLFLEKCSSNIPGVGLAAIGLATEYIVPQIYSYIAEAIDIHTDFNDNASLFFRLHIQCDEGHGENMIQIALDLAESISNREAIRFGVISSLNLRNSFWDSQYSRALALEY